MMTSGRQCVNILTSIRPAQASINFKAAFQPLVKSIFFNILYKLLVLIKEWNHNCGIKRGMGAGCFLSSECPICYSDVVRQEVKVVIRVFEQNPKGLAAYRLLLTAYY
jgi:hypothetical protein